MAIEAVDLAIYPLCRNLSTTQLTLVARHLRRLPYMPGAMVIGQTEPSDTLYLVAGGTLHVLVDQPDGASVILAVLGPRALVGEMGVLQSAGRSATVIAAERAMLLALDSDAFQHLLHDIPQLALNLNAILAQRLRLANAQIVALSAADPAARIARTLLTLASEQGVARAGAVIIPFRLTQGDLARITCLSRAAVNKVFVELARRRVLRSDTRQHVSLLDLAALETLGRW
jgi:CRP-like cAMP-binding protein